MYTLFTQAKTFFIHTDLPQRSTSPLHKNTILQDRSLSFISSLSHDSSLSNLNKNPQPHSDTTLKIISILHMDSLVTSILSMAVKHGPCLLTLKKGSRLSSQVPKETAQHLLLGTQDQWLGAKQDQLSCGSRGTSSDKCQETKNYMVWACQMPCQPLQNHPSGHLGGWAITWWAKEMLDGQYQRLDVPAHARTAHNNFLQKTLRENLCWTVCNVPLVTQSVKELNWTPGQ